MHLLIFTSVVDLAENIDKLGNEFRKFEPVDTVAGVHFCDRQHSLEVIEGSEQAVRQRFDSVSEDPRTSGVRMLIDQPVEHPSLTDRRFDSFLVDMPELVTPESIAHLCSLYTLHFPMNGAGFVQYLEDMIEALDRFGILQQAVPS